MLVLSTRIVLDCFYLLIFYSEKFSTDVCRLSYAVNVNLNLSNVLFHAPLVSSLCDLTSPQFASKLAQLYSKNLKGELCLIIMKTINNLRRIN